MTIATALQWSLTLAALCISIFALFAASRSSARSLSGRLSEHWTLLREQQATLDTLAAELKAMRQRETMRAYRARKRGKSEESDEPEVTDGRSWVQDMNERLARARMGVPK